MVIVAVMLGDWREGLNLLPSGENSRSGKKCSHFNFPSKHKPQVWVLSNVRISTDIYAGQNMVHWLLGTWQQLERRGLLREDK